MANNIPGGPGGNGHKKPHIPGHPPTHHHGGKKTNDPGGGKGGGGGNGPVGGGKNPPTTGGGGGSGGGGPIGGGGNPPTVPPTTPGSQAKDRWASYLSIIEGWLGANNITSDMIAFAHHAADQHWTTGSFLYFARQTAWYQIAFKGIRPGQSEAQYNAIINGYQQAATTLNYHITRDQAQFALSRNIPISVFRDKVSAIQKVNSNMEFFQNFEKTLRAQGFIKQGQMIKKTDLYNFAMHRGPVGWDNVLNEAYARNAASQAGFHVGANISRAEVLRIAEKVGLDATLTSEQQRSSVAATLTKDYQTFAQVQSQAGAHGSLAGFVDMHLSKKEQEDLSFGGPSAVRAKAKLQGILDSYAEAIKGAVQPQLVETSTGAKLLGGLENLGSNTGNPV